jgi:hypothetical protein
VAWVVVLVAWVLYFHFTAVLPHVAPSAESSPWWWCQAWWCFHLASCLWLFQGGTASYFSVTATPPPPLLLLLASSLGRLIDHHPCRCGRRDCACVRLIVWWCWWGDRRCSRALGTPGGSQSRSCANATRTYETCPCLRAERGSLAGALIVRGFHLQRSCTHVRPSDSGVFVRTRRPAAQVWPHSPLQVLQHVRERGASPLHVVPTPGPARAVQLLMSDMCRCVLKMDHHCRAPSLCSALLFVLTRPRFFACSCDVPCSMDLELRGAGQPPLFLSIHRLCLAL